MRRGSLFARLLSTHLLVALGTLLALGIVADRFLERRVVHQLRDRLVSEARTVRSSFSSLPAAELRRAVQVLGDEAGTRITVIRSDGVVLADSDHDPALMENHASRPEVRSALTGAVGSAERNSETVRRPFLYVALPLRDGVVVRTALPTQVVNEQRSDVRNAIALSFVVATLLALGFAAVAARSVAGPLSALANVVARIRPGDRVVVPQSGPPEVRRVARALEEMAGAIVAGIEELKGETALREQVLSSMSEGVLLAEPSGAIAYANAPARRLLGDLARLPASLVEMGDHEIALHHPERRDVRAVTVAVPEGRTLVVMEDVTHARRVEAIRRDFVADASHEMKTPVAAVLATAETLEHAIGDDPDAARRFARRLVEEAHKLSALVGDLLDLSRVERSGVRPLERLSLSSLVETEAARFREPAARKGLGFHTDIRQDVEVEGRPEDLALVVRNLLDNAFRYTDRGGVALTVAEKDGDALVTVSDTGVGIPRKELARIFERFYRVDKARSRETGGTGLGLSIVRNIVEAHGGRVAADSRLGRGSEFVVTLPASAI